MTSAQRKRYEKALRELLSGLEAKRPHRIDPNRIDGERAGVDEDVQPLNEMHQAIASTRNRSDVALIARAERALAKLRDDPDDFGACEECGEEIAPGRLAAMPYADRCTDCQAKRDGPRAGPTRKNLTDYVE